MSSSLKLVTLALLSVKVSGLPGPDPGTYQISKTIWATEKEVPSYGRKKGNLEKSVSKNIVLVGGESNEEGNVLLNGKPICDDKWDDRDAKVVCRMLGFSSDRAFATIKSQFGLVSRDFIMTDVQCKGVETDLNDCYHRDDDNCGTGDGAGVRCGVSTFDDELKEELEEIKDDNEELQTKLSAQDSELRALRTKLDGLSNKFTKLENTVNFDQVVNVTQDVLNLKASDQKQETRIVDNTQKLKAVSRHGKWCGYQDNWSTANSIITYDSLKLDIMDNMNITRTPLDIKTGIFTVPVSGVWRVTISMRSRTDNGESNYGMFYFNNNQLLESEYYTYSSGATVYSVGQREVTLKATTGDTIYFKTSTMKDAYHYLYFCVAFEHGSIPQSRFSADDEDIPGPESQDSFSARDEEISHPEYQDYFSAGDEDIPGPEYQDHFSSGDEEFVPTDLEKSTCSSNADCPPHLACTRSVLSSDLGTCGDPWCWREEWDCGSGSRCFIVNHKPLCV